MKGFFNPKNERLHYLMLVLVVIIASVFSWGATYGDSASYLKTANYLFGYEGGVRLEHRMIRPVTLFMAGAMAPAFGLINSFAIVNIIFGILTSVVIYKLVMRMYKKPKLAFYAALLFATSIPVLSLGASVLTEMPAYFATVMVIYIVYQMKKEMTYKDMIIAALLLSFSMLIRETSMFILPIFFLLSRYGERKVLLKGGAIIILAFAFTSVYYFAYNVNPLNYTLNSGNMGMSYNNPEKYGVERIILSFMAFEFLPIFAFLGFVADSDRKRLIAYYAMFVSFLPVFLWPVQEWKITYTVFPLIMALSVFGIDHFSQRLSEKPLFSRLGSRWYEFLIILMYVIIGVIYCALVMPQYIIAV